MKKLIIIVLLIIVLSGCSYPEIEIDRIAMIEISNNNCKIKSDLSTHSGFHGDGEYFARIYCENINERQLSNNWKKLPLKKRIKELANAKYTYNDNNETMYERYNLSNITEGYYFFLNRNNKDNKYDYFSKDNRVISNYTIAVYDSNNSIIYYYELDT